MMRSSKSHRNIAIIVDYSTESSSHHKNIGNCSTKSVKPSTRKSKTLKKSQSKKLEKPLSETCKHLQNDSHQLFKSDKSSEKYRTRQNSNVESNESPIYRKTELDSICMQRMVNQLKKYLIEKRELWNFSELNYHQLIKILWVYRYIPFATEQQFLEKQQNSELRKVFSLWLSISSKLHFHIMDLLTMVTTFENLDVSQYQLSQMLSELLIELNKQTGLIEAKYDKCDPHYMFFMKKQGYSRGQHGWIVLSKPEKQRIVKNYGSFRLNRLNDSSPVECVTEEEEHHMLSKKSTQLATSKRKKIQQQIKQNKPQITSICLHDILSYKQNSCTPKSQSKPRKMKSSHKKRTINVDGLSKPKPHPSQKTSDEILYEKYHKQYTFHPKTSINQPSFKPDKNVCIKNADKVILRMKQARNIKKQKENIIQKGWTNQAQTAAYLKASFKKTGQKTLFMSGDKDNEMMSIQDNQSEIDSLCSYSAERQTKQNQETHDKQIESALEQIKQENGKEFKKVTKYQVCKDYLRIPLLYIDVNIEEGKKERIVIYDDDTSEDLAQQFAKKHSLSSETSQKLQILLQQQMDTVLSRIDQEAEEECSYIY